MEFFSILFYCSEDLMLKPFFYFFNRFQKINLTIFKTLHSDLIYDEIWFFLNFSKFIESKIFNCLINQVLFSAFFTFIFQFKFFIRIVCEEVVFLIFLFIKIFGICSFNSSIIFIFDWLIFRWHSIIFDFFIFFNYILTLDFNWFEKNFLYYF